MGRWPKGPKTAAPFSWLGQEGPVSSWLLWLAPFHTSSHLTELCQSLKAENGPFPTQDLFLIFRLWLF